MRKRKLSSNLAWHLEDLRKAGPGWHGVPVDQHRTWQALERRGLVDFRKAKLADLHDWARTKPKQQPPRRPRSLRVESDSQDELLLNPHNDDPSAQVSVAMKE